MDRIIRFHLRDFNNWAFLSGPRSLTSHRLHASTSPAFRPHCEIQPLDAAPCPRASPSVFVPARTTHLHGAFRRRRKTALRVSDPLMCTLVGGQHPHLNQKRQALIAMKASWAGAMCTPVCYLVTDNSPAIFRNRTRPSNSLDAPNRPGRISSLGKAIETALFILVSCCETKVMKFCR